MNNRIRRQTSVRMKIRTKSSLPRLSVFRSNKSIYAQVIDDAKRVTVAAAKGKDAKIVGQTVAKNALGAKVSAVVLDRGAYRYHGRVKALAEAAREAGLSI